MFETREKERDLRVIFLDIDGVLVTRKSLFALKQLSRGMEGRAGELHAADPDCVAALNRIYERVPDCNIVVSSTWRLDHSLSGLMALLLAWGVFVPVLVGIGKTPRLIFRDGPICVALPRGAEIQEWLARNGKGVDSFVILDDDSDMEPHMDRLVKTSMEGGLTMEHAERAIAILGAR